MKGKDAEYCKKCRYHGTVEGLGYDVVCNYILVTNEPRGCKPGYGCPKRDKGDNMECRRKLQRVVFEDD